jgi:glycosyltransferase involved in cell wall biosynthesis
MNPRLSVVLITHNEEKNIRRTLESVRWADEIVVIDSGSTDATVAICREYTDKVYHQEWLGYGRQKNLAIDRSSGEWILSLDADEPIEPALADEIRRIISSAEALDGYWIPRKAFVLGKWIRHGGWYPDYNLRLFRRGKGRFEERVVHEAVRVDGRLGRTRAAIEHHSYPDLSSYMSALDKYSSLSVEVMARTKITAFRASWINILFRPVLTFLFKYFFRLGFLDGKAGFVLNVFHSYYVFAKYAKAWEYKYRVQGQGARIKGQGREKE